MSQIEQTRERTDGEPQGIGGWLIFPVLGLCGSPFIQLWVLWNDLSTFDTLGHLQVQQSVFLVIEAAVTLALYVAAPLYLMTLLFQKKAKFPRLYQLLLASSLGWMLLDLALTFALIREAYVSGATQLFDEETVQAMAPSAVHAAIWIPYMSLSVRVRNTFIN